MDLQTDEKQQLHKASSVKTTRTTDLNALEPTRRPPPCPQRSHTLSRPHHHQVMELSETNYNTLTGYTHMARVGLYFGVGAHFWAVQWMDLQLSPTTTITILHTKHL